MKVMPGPQPKYVSLAEQIRREIRSGKMKAGDRLPPYGEAQSLYGTTKATLERAHGLLEQDGLIVRRPGSGVYVAGPQRRARTGTIGVIQAPLAGQGGFPGAAHSSYESRLLHAIRVAADQSGTDVMLLHGAPSPGWEKVDGILGHGHGAGVVQALGAGIPIVAMMHSAEGVPSVVADEFNGAREATEYLFSIGHEKIAFLVDATVGNPISRQRLAGYRAALDAVGIQHTRLWLGDLKNWGLMYKRGLFSMRQWLKKGFADLGCTALLVQNDLAAAGAIEALREAGIAVPGKLSVMGFDNSSECELVSPQLASVHVPLEEIGACATELLLRQINDEVVDLKPVVFSTRLELRGSVAPPSRTSRKKPS